MKKKACFVATLEMSVKVFLTDHMRLLQDMLDLTVIVNTRDERFLRLYGIEAKVVPVGIERNISLVRDVKALFALFKIFRRERFDIIHSIMPKSGLLSMVAGLFARVPVRIHTFTGQVWKNSTGMKRFVLKTMDRVLAFCATHILVDGPSQREFLISEGIVSRKKSSVIGNGSMCGVDDERFSFNEMARKTIRDTYGIANDDVVFFFLGRMNKDKGVLDLANAFSSLCDRFGNVHLLLAGPDEEHIGDEVMEICTQYTDKVHILGYTDVPEKCMSAADVFCLPSYREGFGLVIIEAAAVGIPSIGSRIYGIIDTIDDGATGFFFELADVNDLMQKMARFVVDVSLIKDMGKRARTKALKQYSKKGITSAMVDYYRALVLSP